MSSTPSTGAARFGTFAGVFTPNILTILGLILFLRMGWVVGQAGLLGALAIVLLANAISFLTGLSLSSIATNMRVRAGGNYYLISRSLGLEIGGAIGIPLYLSQAISVAFYIIGFTEALRSLEPFAAVSPQVISSGVALLFMVIAYIGADFALRIQFGILAVLLAALVSFFTGGWGTGFMEPTLEPNYTEGIGFWAVFAVFFPAVTGIEVGTSLSGDLKNPSRSIPRGTIASILFTAAIYVGAVFWFALNATPEALINDNLVMQDIASVSVLILAGVWASTLSSALGSVLAAPRTLQALASDRVVPYRLASRLGSATEPRMAVLVTGSVSLVVIWMGDLDFVAPIISMFFLNTYGMVNLAAAIERLVGNPSFRPRFMVPWQVSMLGAVGCYAAMFLINAPATVLAIIISLGVYFSLERRQLRRTWGDVRNGFWFAVARYALLNLEKERWHVKNWRPNIIVFTGQPHNRQQLVEMADWLSLGRGVVTFFQFVLAKGDREADSKRRDVARKHIRMYIDAHGMQAFAEAEVVTDFEDGAKMVAQAHGLGGLQANTLLLGWSGTPDGRAMQIRLMREFVALHKSVLFLHYDPVRGFGERKTINIWWKGKGSNADMMLLLAHIIEGHGSWKQATVQLLRVVENDRAVAETQAHMAAVLDDVRVRATPVCLVRDDTRVPLAEFIKARNMGADLTIIGMDVPDEVDADAYATRMNDLVKAVGSVLMVRNAETTDDLLDPDE